ncbi:DUF3558 domain-containing protein [Rhodococcus sp. D2-41]|uniref:DUF3558 family protein n=1 Tax=Speluncibacter jeojiensis TaxID=2710754 RepID=UPI0024103F52|nr:DUF3558 family protein [Rhodococcus sp. D2-41]MDG3011426.1 DUF3558 domain-containing protein [Rhodococcus sp. D2-41]
MRVPSLIAAAGLSLVLGGCASNSVEAGSAPNTSTPATTHSSASTPAVAAESLDPCSDSVRDALVKLGYDPTSRQRQEPIHGVEQSGKAYLATSCMYQSDLHLLTVSSMGRSLKDQQQNNADTNDYTQVLIAGRNGVIARDPREPGGCALFFQTSYGEVMLTRSDREKALDQGLEECTEITNTAEAIAAVLPPGA